MLYLIHERLPGINLARKNAELGANPAANFRWAAVSSSRREFIASRRAAASQQEEHKNPGNETARSANTVIFNLRVLGDSWGGGGGTGRESGGG